jgi:hypothetical protein
VALAIATSTQDSYPPRVLVSVTGLTAGDVVTVYRSVGGVRTQLRGGEAITATDPSLVITDAELPFGIPVTYVAEVLPATAWSYVGSGTAGVADAASVAPTVHASKAAGDLLLGFHTTGDTNFASIPQVPFGWTEIARSTNMLVSAKVSNGTETSATMTYSGGLGDACIGLISCLRPVGQSLGSLDQLTTIFSTQTNVSAQNIATPALTGTTAGMEVVHLLWKADDNTAFTAADLDLGTSWSVNTSTLLGNDRCMPVSGKHLATTADVPADTVTVTGGAAAISRALVLGILLDDPVTLSAIPVTVTLTGGKVAVSDAITGQAAEVVISAWPSKKYSRDSSRFNVNGRTIIVSGPLSTFESEIELFTESDSSRENLLDVLDGATSGVVQIRQPGGYGDVDSYISVTDVDQSRYSQDGSDPRRLFTISAFEVDPWPDSFLTQGSTLQDLADAFTGLTLSSIASTYSTLLQIAQADLS